MGPSCHWNVHAAAICWESAETQAFHRSGKFADAPTCLKQPFQLCCFHAWFKLWSIQSCVRVACSTHLLTFYKREKPFLMCISSSKPAIYQGRRGCLAQTTGVRIAAMKKRWTSQLQTHLILRLYLEMPLQLWPVNTLNISGPLHMMAQPVKSHFARCRTWSSTFCRGGGRGRAQLSGYQSDCNWPTVLIGWQHLERPKLFVGPPVHKPFLWFMIWPFEITKTILAFMPYSCTLSIITVQHVGFVQKNMSLVQCLL